jgi:hypothetical protein
MLVLVPATFALTFAAIAVHHIIRDTEDVRIFKSDRKSFFRGELKGVDINEDMEPAFDSPEI